MSKRSRGSRRAQGRRPGGRSGGRPARHGQSRAAVRPEPRRVEIVEYDEDVDELVAAEPEHERQRPAVNVLSARSRVRPSAALAARAATEYVYVAQDLRRIVVVGTLLFAVMFALWIVIVVARVVQI